ncbi:nodulin MtN21 /EamA-like transporter family protein [Striga asiatica]|uniref:WAT1-related protein n=1 Tax=Striga asiatica TaxID=4170 RepID=A0A5A7QQX2_STRAF|nr:nodulin MtN21 /EamA-like transporter family protein [Striga asiatica]
MEINKPFLGVVTVQLIYAVYFVLTKLAFDVGMNTFVFVCYRQAAGTLVLAPIALLVEGKRAPPLSFTTFSKIFMFSLLGITVSLDVVGVGLKYTSASLGAATTNTLPVLTFFLAVLLRLETLNLRTSPGIMKIAGVGLCVGGIVIIAFYRGPLFKLLLHDHLISSYSEPTQEKVSSSSTWIKGVFLMLLSQMAWALWLVLQGRVLKSYPSKLLLTALQCLLSTVQSFIIAVGVARDPAQWKLSWNIRLVSVAYCGIVVTGFTFYLQAWIIEKKGPVYLAMATPLVMVFTILLSAVFLGTTISLGSMLGAIFLIGGLYFVLWGKRNEEKSLKKLSQIGDVENAPVAS